MSDQNQMLNNHEERISKLESQHLELSKKMSELDNSVVKGNLTTQQMQQEIKDMQQQQNKQVDKVFDMLYGLVQQNRESETSLGVTKMKTKSKVLIGIFGGLFSAGGLSSLVMLVIHFF